MGARIRELVRRARERVGGGESEQGLWTGLFVLALALVVAAVLLFGGGSGSDRPSDGPGALPTASMDPEGAWNPYAEVGGDGGAGGAPPRPTAQWTPVVRTFVSGFLGAAQDARWLAAVRPVVTPQLLERLRYVRRSGVPTGSPGAIRIQASGDYTVDLTVTYADHRALGVRVVDLPKDGRGWMVYGYQDRSG